MSDAGPYSWPKESVSRLKALHGEGKSFAEIANVLSLEFRTRITRSAAIGKAQRIGLCGTKEQARQKQLKVGAARRAERELTEPPKRAPKAPSVVNGVVNPMGPNSTRTYVAPVVLASSISAAERQAKIDAIAIEPKVMVDPKWGGCKWPLHRTADDGAMLSCCNTKPTDQPYCDDHTHLARQKNRTPDQIAVDAKAWSANVERSGVNTKATRYFNTPLEMAS